jgi:hypothetical protein
MQIFICLALLLTVPPVTYSSIARQDGRTLAGNIYFTNNTPHNRETFPIELYTQDQRRRLASTKPDAQGQFSLTGIKPGKYLLKFTWPPDRCTLRYRVDVRKGSNTNIRIIMDAACARHDGSVLDLPAN